MRGPLVIMALSWTFSGSETWAIVAAAFQEQAKPDLDATANFLSFF